MTKYIQTSRDVAEHLVPKGTWLVLNEIDKANGRVSVMKIGHPSKQEARWLAIADVDLDSITETRPPSQRPTSADRWEVHAERWLASLELMDEGDLTEFERALLPELRELLNIEPS
jgi:hypothetical protein